MEMGQKDERVLVLAPAGRDGALAQRVLSGAGLSCSICRDEEALLAAVREGAGVLLITEEALTTGVLEGLANALKDQPAWSDIPVVLLLSGDTVQQADRLLNRVPALSSVTVLGRPVPVKTLVSVVETVLRGRRRQLQTRDLLGQLGLQKDRLEREIADRKRAEAELRAVNETLEERVARRTRSLVDRSRQVKALASALALAEQRERKRIAQVLHDHLQQVLYGLQLQIQLLGMSDGTLDPERLAAIQRLLVEAIKSTRSLSVELSPPVSQEEGLPAALEWLASHMLSVYGLKVTLDVDRAAGVPDDELRVHLFQIARELLFNVVKHAGTSEAEVTLRNPDGVVVLRVADSGSGFEVDPESTFAGFGLGFMRERVDLLGGAIEIDAKPGRGTVVQVEVPLELAPREDAPLAGATHTR
jgi:signal transduction histidine kinase